MKRLLPLLVILLLLMGCSSEQPAQIAATTLPVYDFTARLCEGTGLSVTRLVTEQVSCLHDYSLNVRQVKSAEAADVVVISGAGLEEFLQSIIDETKVIDSSSGIELLCPEGGHDHGHEGHQHDSDPHIWLSPVNAKIMAQNIFDGLCKQYPKYAAIFENNLISLLADLDELQAYGEEKLSDLSCRKLITFHDGFSYFADNFDLTILKAIEEESGREASARELIEIIELVEEHQIPAVFTEANGSLSAAEIIAKEAHCRHYTVNMAMSAADYFSAMYQNIDVIWEALQ